MEGLSEVMDRRKTERESKVYFPSAPRSSPPPWAFRKSRDDWRGNGENGGMSTEEDDSVSVDDGREHGRGSFDEALALAEASALAHGLDSSSFEVRSVNGKVAPPPGMWKEEMEYGETEKARASTFTEGQQNGTKGKIRTHSAHPLGIDFEYTVPEIPEPPPSPDISEEEDLDEDEEFEVVVGNRSLRDTDTRMFILPPSQTGSNSQLEEDHDFYEQSQANKPSFPLPPPPDSPPPMESSPFVFAPPAPTTPPPMRSISTKAPRPLIIPPPPPPELPPPPLSPPPVYLHRFHPNRPISLTRIPLPDDPPPPDAIAILSPQHRKSSVDVGRSQSRSIGSTRSHIPSIHEEVSRRESNGSFNSSKKSAGNQGESHDRRGAGVEQDYSEGERLQAVRHSFDDHNLPRRVSLETRDMDTVSAPQTRLTNNTSRHSSRTSASFRGSLHLNDSPRSLVSSGSSATRLEKEYRKGEPGNSAPLQEVGRRSSIENLRHSYHASSGSENGNEVDRHPVPEDGQLVFSPDHSFISQKGHLDRRSAHAMSMPGEIRNKRLSQSSLGKVRRSSAAEVERRTLRTSFTSPRPPAPSLSVSKNFSTKASDKSAEKKVDSMSTTSDWIQFQKDFDRLVSRDSWEHSEDVGEASGTMDGTDSECMEYEDSFNESAILMPRPTHADPSNQAYFEIRQDSRLKAQSFAEPRRTSAFSNVSGHPELRRHSEYVNPFDYEGKPLSPRSLAGPPDKLANPFVYMELEDGSSFHLDSSFQEGEPELQEESPEQLKEVEPKRRAKAFSLPGDLLFFKVPRDANTTDEVAPELTASELTRINVVEEGYLEAGISTMPNVNNYQDDKDSWNEEERNAFDEDEDLIYMRAPDYPPPPPSIEEETEDGDSRNSKPFFLYEYPEGLKDLERTEEERRKRSLQFEQNQMKKSLTHHPSSNKDLNSPPVASFGTVLKSIVGTKPHSIGDRFTRLPVAEIPKDALHTLDSIPLPEIVDDEGKLDKDKLQEEQEEAKTFDGRMEENKNIVVRRLVDVLRAFWKKNRVSDNKVMITRRVHEALLLYDSERNGCVPKENLALLINETLGITIDEPHLKVIESLLGHSPIDSSLVPYENFVRAVDELFLELQRKRMKLKPSATPFPLATLQSPVHTGKGKPSAGKIPRYAQWLNSLRIWPQETLDEKNFLAGFQNGMLLCCLVRYLLEKRLKTGSSTKPSLSRLHVFDGVNWKVKGATRAPSLKNIEIALSVIWKERGVRARNMPTASQIHNGEVSAVIHLIGEIISTLVFGGSVSTSQKVQSVLNWYDRVLRRVGRQLPTSLLRPPHDGLWISFQKADLLVGVLHHFLPRKIKMECVFYDPNTEAEIRSNCEELFDYLEKFQIPCGLGIQDMIEAKEENIDLLVLLLFAVYEKFKNEPWSEDPMLDGIGYRHSVAQFLDDSYIPNNQNGPTEDSLSVPEMGKQLVEYLSGTRSDVESISLASAASSITERKKNRRIISEASSQDSKNSGLSSNRPNLSNRAEIQAEISRQERKLMMEEEKRGWILWESRQSLVLNGGSFAIDGEKIAYARLYFSELNIKVVKPTKILNQAWNLVGSQMRWRALDGHADLPANGYFLIGDVESVSLAGASNTNTNRLALSSEGHHDVVLYAKAERIERVAFCSNGLFTTSLRLRASSAEQTMALFIHLNTLVLSTTS